MNLQNGYKVIYEKAADGERTFYASKSNVYPTPDDTVLASFTDADFAGKVVYEYKGEFYVSTGSLPAYDENGVPTDSKIEGFDKVFVAETATEEEAITPSDESTEVQEETPEEEPVEAE